MRAEFEDIVDTFEFLDDWEDRYRHIIDMGKSFPELAEEFKTDAFKVDGCASQVWLVPEISGQGESAVLTFKGSSDAMIVKGLIATLHALLNGLTVREIAQTDALAAFARLGLDEHLSSQRSNGLRAMIQRIKDIARAAYSN